MVLGWGGLEVATMSNLNLSCIELELELGFDNFSQFWSRGDLKSWVGVSPMTSSSTKKKKHGLKHFGLPEKYFKANFFRTIITQYSPALSPSFEQDCLIISINSPYVTCHLCVQASGFYWKIAVNKYFLW